MDNTPLVAVIIPTWKRPQYCEEALKSVLAQTYTNLEIFITDNSPGTETAEMIKPYLEQDARIRYEHHPEFTEQDQWDRGMTFCRDSKAEYVNWLMDDDLFAPEKIEKGVGILLQANEIAMVSCYRKSIDEKGNPLSDAEQIPPISEISGQMKAQTVGSTMLWNISNFIGEPTAVLIRKAYLLDGYRLGWTGEEGDCFVSDFPTWLHLMTKGDLFYFAEPLCSLRVHKKQGSKDVAFTVKGTLCWVKMLRHAIDHGIFLTKEEDIQHALLAWTHVASKALLDAIDMEYENGQADELQRVFNEMTRGLRFS